MIPNKLLAKIRNEIFSKDDLELYIKCFINCLELDDYYCGIIHDDEIDDSFAEYNFYTKNIDFLVNVFILRGICRILVMFYY